VSDPWRDFSAHQSASVRRVSWRLWRDKRSDDDFPPLHRRAGFPSQGQRRRHSANAASKNLILFAD
jgi:hypothetical protein